LTIDKHGAIFTVTDKKEIFMKKSYEAPVLLTEPVVLGVFGAYPVCIPKAVSQFAVGGYKKRKKGW